MPIGFLTKGFADFRLKNKTALITGQKTVAVAGTADQIASNEIPDGFVVVVKALSGNTGKVYVADSQTKAQTAAQRYELGAGQFVTLQVSNTNIIWLNSQVSGEGVSFIVEG